MIRKILSLALALLLVFSMSACAPAADTSAAPEPTEEAAATPVPSAAPKYAAGTYTGTAQGMGGPLSVEVTFTDDAITGVAVTENAETYGIGQGLDVCPVESIPAWIVENQSLAFDGVTGATITSSAVVNAVADAVTQAGGDAEALRSAAAESAPAEDETLSCDVVVAGGGASGLAAALSALQNGSSVILVEKQGVTGGSTTRSGGYVIAAGTELQKAQGIEDTPDAMFEFFNEVADGKIDAAKVQYFCDNSAATFEWIVENGAQFQDVIKVHETQTVARVHNSLNGQFMGSGQGGQITVSLTKKIVELGGTILYNTAADGLIVSADGSVTGITATKKDGGKVTVSAGAVILATGGYAGDKELCERFTCMPNYVSGAPSSNTGDALKMVEAVDGQVEWDDYANITFVSMTSGVGCFEEAGLIVDEFGSRFCDEYNYFYHVADGLIKSGSTCGWYIADADDPNPTVQYAMTLDSTPKAATAEELAAQINMDPAVLSATIARYNELCEAGEDKDFGKPAEFLNAIDGDTIYAIQMTPNISGTYGGIMTDVDTHVLNNSNEAVPGLYAAGEVAFCGLVGDEYPCCGTAIGTGLCFGRLAGANAAAYAAE